VSELAGWERKFNNKSELCALFHKVSGSANMKRKMGAAADRATEEEDADRRAGRKNKCVCHDEDIFPRFFAAIASDFLLRHDVHAHLYE